MGIAEQTAFIAGGSRGLGKELAKELASRGMNVVIFARNKEVLSSARDEIAACRKSGRQSISTVSIDLSNGTEVAMAIRGTGVVPDYAFCVAGGTPGEGGFFAELSHDQLDRCMRNNYMTAMWFSHACVRLWLERQEHTATKHLVFISSVAAFVGLPGYSAYAPAKVAVRSLADTLRQELLLYGGKDRFQVHCSFPGTFISDGFHEEQTIKPELLKVLEETDQPMEVLEKTKPHSVDIARDVLNGVDKGTFAITHEWQGSLLLNNMRGPTPRESLLWDTMLSGVGALVWPFYRRMWDRTTAEYGRKMKKSN